MAPVTSTAITYEYEVEYDNGGHAGHTRVPAAHVVVNTHDVSFLDADENTVLVISAGRFIRAQRIERTIKADAPPVDPFAKAVKDFVNLTSTILR